MSQPSFGQRLVSIVTLLIPLGLLAAGLYLLACSLAPYDPIRPKVSIAKLKVAPSNQLIISQLGLVLPIHEGDKSVLEKGIWHRFPERGNPHNGGNFILAGHRFVMGATPGETIHRSPLYHVDQLKTGDDIYVDWTGKRYKYKITRIYSVKPNAVSIEAPSAEPKLTLYTCTSGGAADGRVVIEAKLVN